MSTVCDGQLKWICASGITVYCIRRAVKWPILAGYAGYEQRVSTVRDNSRTMKVLNAMVYCMRCPVKRPGLAGYARQEQRVSTVRDNSRTR